MGLLAHYVLPLYGEMGACEVADMTIIPPFSLGAKVNFHRVKGGESVGLLKWLIALVVLLALTLLLGYLAWKAEQRCEDLNCCFACYAFGVSAAFTGVLALTAGIRLVVGI